VAAAAPLRLSHDHWDRRAAALTGPAAGRSARYISISHLIETYGYLAVFLLVGAESLGIPLPGETALILAGTYAGHTHRLSPWLIFLVAAAAAVIGDNIGYWIGDKGGYRLARRYGPKVRLDEHKLKIARYLFDRYDDRVVRPREVRSRRHGGSRDDRGEWDCPGDTTDP